MIRKRIGQWIAGLLIFVLMTGHTSPVIHAMVNEDNIIRGYNPFIEYLVDKRDGRYIIRTLEGVPQKTSDNNSKLMFERDNDPETSYTTFRIDGEDYIYGNSYIGKSGLSKNHYTTGDGDGMLSVSEWDIQGLNIKQALEIIEDPEHPNVGNVRIRYEVTNESTVSRSVGNRIMLDTQLGSNDGASFVVGDSTIRTETVLTGNAIPDFYRTSDDELAPNVIGYGFMRGWGQEAPEKVVFAHYNTLSDSKWDVTTDSNLDFTSDTNAYQGADSAVAYYFGEKGLAPGETRTFETFYGIGDFSHYDSDSTYNVMLSAPEQLTVNDTKDGYVEDPVTVTVTIDNAMETSMNMTGVTVTLVKQDARFADVAGEDYTLEIPLIEKGQVKSYEFRLKPLAQEDYLSEPIKVSVSSDNSETAQSAYDYILMPNISGALPELTIEAVSPDTVYFEGFREFSLTGSGYNMLNNKGLWELYLVASDGREQEIPDNNVSIVSDEQLNITIYEDTFAESTPAGEYVFKMVHSDLGTILTPQSKAIKFSEDIQFKSRKYGVLYVERKAEMLYEIGLADSSEALEALKDDVNRDIVLDIVGDVVETTDQSGKVTYKVKTDQQDAVINSVVKYKDGNKPLEIKKSGDLITLHGDGTLQIVGSNEFWWWSFYSYIADGTDYNMSEVLIEDEEDDALFEINPEWSEGSGDEEEQSNITIDFFNPINAVGAAVNTFYDGFNVEIKSVVLLDEGASFGGSVELEIPFGAPVPAEPEEEEELTEEEMDDVIAEALQDLFLTDEERQKKFDEREKKDARTELSTKLRALFLTDEGVSEEIDGLIESSDATPAVKAQTILQTVLGSPELLMMVYDMIRGNGEEDEDDRKSVGVTIDVKKVVFGKKYGEDFLSEDVRYIGLQADGEIMVTLPFGTEDDREDQQGIRAYASIDSISGEYTFEADVDLELAEAHAIVSIVKVGSELKPDHIELSGGFSPGVPLTPPVFISSIGGGVKNLQGKGDDEPLTIIMILGLDVVPAFEGDFRAEVSKSGFTLQGEFELKGGMKILKEAYIALHWDRPVYFACGASIDLFDVIAGSASVYIGEIPVEGGGYKFYFEGKVSVAITIPDPVWFVGGMEVGSAELGMSTEKIWGSIKVIGIGVGITYVYGEGVRFSDGAMELALENLTDVSIPENAMYSDVLIDENGNVMEGQFLVGSNIRKLADSETYFVDADGFGSDVLVIAAADNTSYDFVVADQDSALFEIVYEGDMPGLAMTDPNGNTVSLVEGVNYMTRTLSAEDSPSGEAVQYIYISVVDPLNGTYTVTSDKSLEVGTMYEAKALPELTSLDYTLSGDQMDISFTAAHGEDALVSVFLVHNDGSEYAIGSNIDAMTGSVSLPMPASLPEGTYTVRASIAHPSYGFHDMVAGDTFSVTDPYKPSPVGDIQVTYAGNGVMSSQWTHADAGADMAYYLTVYDAYGNALEGFTDLYTDSQAMPFGGTYTGVDAAGDEHVYEMPFNQSYSIGVTAVRTRTLANGDKTRHISGEVRSESFVKRQPTPPSLMVRYLDDYIYTGDSYYFNQKTVTIEADVNQQSDITVYLDGEFFGTFRGRDRLTLQLELEDGPHAVRYECVNALGDRSTSEASFAIDTQAPDLRIDSPATTIVADTATVLVKGNVESGANAYMNGQPLTVDSDGNFTTSYTMDMTLLRDHLQLKAVDVAGNETVYNSELINGSLSPIEAIVIDDSVLDGMTGQTTTLSVSAVDSTGKSVQMDNEDLTFKVIKGAALGRVTDNGEVTFFDSGQMAVMASFALTDDYMLTDAVEYEIQGSMEVIQIVPELTRIEAGRTVDMSLVGQSKFSETALDDTYASYSILSGSSFASIDGNRLTLKSAGSVTVAAVYDKDGVTLSTTMTFTVYGRTDSSTDEEASADYADYEEAPIIEVIDTVLNGVWQNLLEREKELQITSVREIRKDIDTKISMQDVGSLLISGGTVADDDVFLSGVVLNSSDLIDGIQFRQGSEVYELTFKNAGGKLENDIVLRLKHDGTSTDDTLLGIYVYNEIFNRWQFVSDTVEGEEVVATLEHLSKYAVLERLDHKGFVDIKNSWARKLIMSLQSLEVVNGIESGGYLYYSPDKDISRIELAALAVRVYESVNGSGEEGLEVVSYADEDRIPEWGKVYAQKAYAYGILKGIHDEDGLHFNPSGTASRAETMTVISRAMGGVARGSVDFTDELAIPDWAKEHIDHLVMAGLVNGYDDGSIRPMDAITRAEVAKLIYYWIDSEVMKGE